MSLNSDLNLDRRFIYTFFDEDTQRAYDSIHNPSHQNTLFRYCFLYKYGGWYIKHGVEMVREEKEDRYTDVVVSDEGSVMYLPPSTPTSSRAWLLDVINEIVCNVLYRSEYYNRNPTHSLIPPLSSLSSLPSHYLLQEIGGEILDGDEILFTHTDTLPPLLHTPFLYTCVYDEDGGVWRVYSDKMLTLDIYHNVVMIEKVSRDLRAPPNEGGKVNTSLGSPLDLRANGPPEEERNYTLRIVNKKDYRNARNITVRGGQSIIEMKEKSVYPNVFYSRSVLKKDVLAFPGEPVIVVMSVISSSTEEDFDKLRGNLLQLASLGLNLLLLDSSLYLSPLQIATLSELCTTVILNNDELSYRYFHRAEKDGLNAWLGEMAVIPNLFNIIPDEVGWIIKYDWKYSLLPGFDVRSLLTPTPACRVDSEVAQTSIYSIPSAYRRLYAEHVKLWLEANTSPEKVLTTFVNSLPSYTNVDMKIRKM